MKAIKSLLVLIATTLILHNSHGQNINLNDLLAAVKANNKNLNNDEHSPSQEPKTYSSTSLKTQEFGGLQSLMSAMKGGGDGNTVNLDIASLLSKQAGQQGVSNEKNEKTVEISPNGEATSPSQGAINEKSETSSNENSGGLDLGQIAKLLKLQQQQQTEKEAAAETKETEGIQNNINHANNVASFLKKSDDDLTGPPGLNIETEGDNSKDGHSRFALQRSPDGGLMLVPVKEETGSSRGLDIAELMKKPGNAVGGTNRQQLQLTSLVCHLYSQNMYLRKLIIKIFTRRPGSGKTSKNFLEFQRYHLKSILPSLLKKIKL